MIDLKSKPEGATHYRKLSFYKKSGDNWLVHFFGGWVPAPIAGCELDREAVKIEPEWSIYNNTLPLSELSDKQAGELFNHWRGGGEKLIEVGDEFIDCPIAALWSGESVYRAKQKTERELFIDAMAAFVFGRNDCAITALDAGELFDAGFKAPKGE